jgi:hypothetical protein
VRLGAPLIVIAAAVVAAGCGAVAAEPPRDGGEPAGTLEPAPRIEAVDEPPSLPWIEWVATRGDVSGEGAGCSVAYYASDDAPVEAPAEPKSCDELSSEERAEFEAHDKQFRALVEPAQGSEPRTIAKLDLAGDRVLSLDGWRSKSGRLCLAEWFSRPDGGGGSGPGGPCLGENDPSCTASLCLGHGGHGVPILWTLAGVIASKGERLRLTLRSGTTKTYPLTGPLAPGFPEYRVFLLELGREQLLKVELLRAGVVVAQDEVPAELADFRDCLANAAPDAMQECVGSAK